MPVQWFRRAVHDFLARLTDQLQSRLLGELDQGAWKLRRIDIECHRLRRLRPRGPAVRGWFVLLLRGRLKSEPDARDVAQEVYLRLLRPGPGELVRDPRAYVYFVARQVLAQFRLRERRSPVVYDSLEVETSDAAPQDIGSDGAAAATGCVRAQVEMFLRASATEKITDFLSVADCGAVLAKAGSARLSNVVSPRPEPEPPSVSQSRHESRHPALAWMAAAVAAAVVGLGWYFTGPGSRQSYSTAAGEQRTVALNDGSLAHVNTDSRIAVRYSGGCRDIRLTRGETLFSVEPDPARPFRVHSAGAVVQAVGTVFNVRRIDGKTRVAVIQGAVAVSGSGKTASVSAPVGVGQGLKVTGGKDDQSLERQLSLL